MGESQGLLLVAGALKGRLAAGLVIIACCAVFQFFTLRTGQSWMDDAFMYVMHAENLAAGRPYAQTCYVYNPLNPYAGPAQYPPGYPAALSVVVRAGGGLRAMKAANVLFLAALLCCVLLLADFPAGDPRALGLVAVLGFCPVLWDFKDLIYSDFLFCALVYLALLVYRRARGAAGQRLYAAAGLSCWLAYSVRPLGALLPAAFALEALVRREGRRGAAVLAAAFAVPAAAQAFFFPAGVYGGLLALPRSGGFLPAAGKVLGGFLGSLTEFWYLPPGRGGVLAAYAALGLSLLALAGYAAGLRERLGKRGPDAMDFFAALYVGTVVLFRMYDGIRYIFPLMPWLVWKALEGFGAFGSARAARRWTAAFLAAAFGLYAWSFASGARYGALPGGPYEPAAQQMFSFVKKASSEGDTVVFVKPRSMCFFTGRKSEVYPPAAGDAALTAWLRETGASYLVASRIFPQDAAELYGFIARNRGLLEKVYENPDYKVFRIRKGGLRGFTSALRTRLWPCSCARCTS